MHIPRSAILTLLLAVMATAVTGCARWRSGPPVILITIDTLRADHLGCYGYFRDTSPNIDRLAREGVRFENVISTTSTTLPAHTSLMTSSYPVRHGVLSNLDIYRQPVVTTQRFRMAAQMFRDAGYRTAGFVSAGVLGSETGIGIGFETFDVQKSQVSLAMVTMLRANRWVDRQKNGRFFLWIHLYDPHYPYSPPLPYHEMYKTDADLEAFVRETGVPEKNLERAFGVNNLYDGEIRYTDEHVGRFLDHLREIGLYDASLIVLTADHGEGLLQHDELTHGPVFNEDLDIPLIMKFPAGRGPERRTVGGVVSLIDVLPTIAEQLDLPLDRDQFDGRNAFHGDGGDVLAQRERDAKRFGLEDNHVLRDHRWKYDYYSESPDTLHDLANDYRELTNVIDEHPEIAARMKRRLLELLAEHRRRGADLEIQPEIPPGLYEELKSLGYVD